MKERKGANEPALKIFKIVRQAVLQHKASLPQALSSRSGTTTIVTTVTRILSRIGLRNVCERMKEKSGEREGWRRRGVWVGGKGER